jgi:single-stranded DNA-binding protein
MQLFVAYGRVAKIPTDAFGESRKGTPYFKFDFVCDSSQRDAQGKFIPSFFHVETYGKQAELMYQSLSKGSPILVKGEIVQRPYLNDQQQQRTYQVLYPSLTDGITFLESKTVSEQRRRPGLGLQTVPPAASHSPYPDPLDADEPF